MANHKSAEKAHRKSLISKARNSAILSRIKTFSTKFESALTGSNVDSAKQALREAESEIRAAVSKGVLKLNTASRKVSRITRKFKTAFPGV